MENREIMAPAYVYMVRCGGGQLYTGWTTDPAARLHAHKTGKGAKYTRAAGAETPADPERYRDWVAQASRTAPVVLARDEAGRLLAFACAHPWKEREQVLLSSS